MVVPSWSILNWGMVREITMLKRLQDAKIGCLMMKGGHLIASIFDGSGNLDNLVPMNGNLNKGEWKKLESMWAKQLKKGKSVEVKVKPSYKGDSQRPDSFKIEYKIGKEDWEIKRFKNKPGGK